jgi:hypothetical protein
MGTECSKLKNGENAKFWGYKPNNPQNPLAKIRKSAKV